LTAKLTVSDMMEACALHAVDHAKQTMDDDLDFSPEGVRKVESILATLFEAKPKGYIAKLFQRGPSPGALDALAKMYGGHIGKGLRREKGGDWYFAEVAPGHQVIGLRKGDRRLWPPAKVGKRLTTGSEDNVWSYFQIVRKVHW
jgi:hypothetical protein